MSNARSWAWIGGGAAMSALVAFVGCGDDGGEGGAQGGASGTEATTTSGVTSSPGATSGGDGGASTTSGATTTVSQGPGPVAVSASISGAGGGPEECDVEPGSLYAQNAVDYDTFQTVNLCEYQDRVLLLVDIAAL